MIRGTLKNYVALLWSQSLAAILFTHGVLSGNQYVSYQFPPKHLDVGSLAGALSEVQTSCERGFNLVLKSGLFW